MEACEALVLGDGGLRPQDPGGDGSTPLFWAVAGVETRRFGTGGHVNVSTPVCLGIFFFSARVISVCLCF